VSDSIGANPNAEINLASDREHKCVSKTLEMTRGILIKMIFAVLRRALQPEQKRGE